jgi:proteasome lid subunit RPN8/RPN11
MRVVVRDEKGRTLHDAIYAGTVHSHPGLSVRPLGDQSLGLRT